MPTIPVPSPPRSAFNKNRPVSDLLEHQLKHFRHLAARLPNEWHSNMTARDLTTENGAATYIAHVTNALRSLHGEVAMAAPIPIRPAAKRQRTIAIAAAASKSKKAPKPAGANERSAGRKGAKARKPRGKRT